MIWASRNGHLEVVEKLIEKGAKVNHQDIYGVTALMMASRNGHLEVVEKLIELGADVNIKNIYINATALMGASIEGNLEIVEKLIIKGADVHQKDIDGNTAMSLAKDEETRKAILNAVKLKKQKDKENEPSFMDRVNRLFGKGE